MSSQFMVHLHLESGSGDPSALPAKRSRIVLIIFPAKIPRAWPPSLADFVENDNAIVAKIKEGQKWRLQLNSGIHT